MTTTADWIADTLWHLGSNTLLPDNRLNGALASGATQIAFKYDLKNITDGAVIAVGLEEIRVWETDGQKTATVVERHINGSTSPASHADLTDVYAKPRFSPYRVLKAINDDIGDLSSPENGLYQVKALPQFTYNGGVVAYDLTGVTDEDDIVEVEYQLPGGSRRWPVVTADEYRIGRDQNTTSFPSGFSITFIYGGYAGAAYRVKYRTPFEPLPADDLTADVADTMLPSTALDLPPLGAALELMAGREVKRNFTEAQPDTRRAAEVPAGATLASVNGLIHQRARRINNEAARLANRYPTMLRTR